MDNLENEMEWIIMAHHVVVFHVLSSYEPMYLQKLVNMTIYIPKLERTCICSGNFGDEFHFIYECRTVKELRRPYLNYTCVRHANTLNFSNLMNSTNRKMLINLAKYIKFEMKLI